MGSEMCIRDRYKYDNIGYAEVPEHHLYNTQNSERSDAVSPYLMLRQLLVDALFEHVLANAFLEYTKYQVQERTLYNTFGNNQRICY